MGKPIEPGCTVVVVAVGGGPTEFLGSVGTAVQWIPEGGKCRWFDPPGIFFSKGEWACDFHGTPCVVPPSMLRRIDDYDPNADELEQEKLDNETI